MKLNLELKSCHIAFLDKTKLVLSGKDTVSIEVKSKYNLDNMFLCVENNGEKAIIKAKNGLFNINSKLLFAGRLTAILRLYEDGEEVNYWKIPPLILSEVNGKVETIEEIDLLKHAYASLNARLMVLEEKQENKDKIKKFFSKGDK